MGIHFRGGELQQKGRGIGGFFRGLAALFKPIMKSVGLNAVKAVKSRTAKKIASTLAKQSVDSGLNMTRDIINGRSLKDSFEHESQAFKNSGVKIIDTLQKKNKKWGRAQNNQPKKRKRDRGNQPKNRPRKIRKRITLKSMRQYE